ncbi:uncharacterized protein LOC142319243 [Lycorma delicatula]|uniref:uncharacterized protein LOC142319243 n=1 Tax=Lycorma delicatula TaxID=130591 RepID=UPI003F515CD0
MLRTVQICARSIPKYKFLSRNPHVRKYLTKAFECEEMWNKRLESPLIKKIKPSDIFYEIENQFLHFGKANGLDIDLFVNSIVDNSHIEEVEDVIHKLRLSPEAMNLLPSTQHAFIRIMLSFGNVDELLRVLDDRLNYGIFMDDYCCILLLNKFLKEENFKNAAKVAAIQMVQEDFSHPLVKYMSLFACHKYILNPAPWISEQTEPEEKDEDDEEEIKLRVRYIRNPYFDDHFDLRDPNHLVGKTLWMIGNETPDVLGRSYTLLGYVLHDKWDKLEKYINSLLDSKDTPTIYKDCISLISKFVEENKGSEQSEVIKNEEQLNVLLSKLKASNSLSSEDFLKATENKMKEVVKELETKSTEDQNKVYEDWEKFRERLVNEHIENMKREKTLQEIEASKQKIKEKEEELFFFDNESKLDLMIEKKTITPSIKWRGKIKKKRAVDAEYVPPEIEKRREN